MEEIESYSILGTKVCAFTNESLTGILENLIDKNEKHIIANHNLHSLYLFNKNDTFRDFFSQINYVHIDGMAIVYLGRLLGYPLVRGNRITYLDWCDKIFKLAVKKNFRIFYLGSTPESGKTGVDVLKRNYPSLKLFWHHGYFDANKNSGENREIINLINSSKASILMVGMGMPRQEYWIRENFKNLNVNICLPCGACLDYLAGTIQTPPRWMGRIGLEWFYRLITEPQRLWKRYLIEPLFLCKPFLVQFLKQKKKIFRT